MTFKSGFTNENSAVRWERAPGPLRQAAGFTYQEFSNLEHPLPLRNDPFHVGTESNLSSSWAEFLQLQTAKPLAFYDHPFFGQWPAITENHFGSGTLTYEGTGVSDKLQQAIVRSVLHGAGLDPDPLAATAPEAVRVKHGVSHDGHPIHYFLNYSGSSASLPYNYPAATDLLTGHALASKASITLPPWDLVIARETGAAR